MSHFSVIVRLPADTKKLDAALRTAMIPYKESGCGEEDPPELKQYLVFEDRSKELMKQYETETTTCVKLPSGEVYSAFDERFRNVNMKSILAGGEQYLYPLGAEKIEVPLKERYENYDKFAQEYCGYKNKHNGVYGYWHNPNQKWDWYTVGGRWSNYFPFTDGTKGDACRLSAIDFDAADKTQNERLENFWNEYQELLSGRECPSFEGPRDTALDIGFISCKNADELTEDERDPAKYKLKDWQVKVERYDVMKIITREELEATKDHFYPLTGFARLDENGWHAAGEMGWFDCSSDTPETNLEVAKTIKDWYRSGNQDDFVVCVDCHI